MADFLPTNRILSLGSGDVAGADLLRLFSQSYGDDVAVTLTNLDAWLNARATVGALTTQYAAPSATGFSVTITGVNYWLILTPGAGYAAGTIVLPTGEDRSEILINCTQSVGTLTVTPATGDTVTGAPTSLSANDAFRLRFDGQSRVWYNVA